MHGKTLAMKVTAPVLGGGRRFFHPRYVWAPIGGWWHDKPPNHDKAWPLVLAGYGVALFAIFQVSSAREVRCGIWCWRARSALVLLNVKLCYNLRATCVFKLFIV
mgnify:CR=1 FL=1